MASQYPESNMSGGPTDAEIFGEDMYKFTAQFNLRTGRFQSSGTMSHWQKKGIPEDSAGRQISQYFDIEAYQEAQRLAKLNPPKKPKVNAKQFKNKKKKKIYTD